MFTLCVLLLYNYSVFTSDQLKIEFFTSSIPNGHVFIKLCFNAVMYLEVQTYACSSAENLFLPIVICAVLIHIN